VPHQNLIKPSVMQVVELMVQVGGFQSTIITISPVEITGLATGWGMAGARDGWLGTG